MTTPRRSPQAPRSQRVGIAVTPVEKKAVKFVAEAKGTDESNLFREYSLVGVMAEYDRLMRVLREGEEGEN